MAASAAQPTVVRRESRIIERPLPNHRESLTGCAAKDDVHSSVTDIGCFPDFLARQTHD